MQNGRIRYEILIGAIMLVVALASILLAYSMMSGVINILDLLRTDAKPTMQNLTLLLILLSIASLFTGAIAGYLIGKYSQFK